MKRKWIAALTAMMMLAAAALPAPTLTVQAAPLVNESAQLHGAAANANAEKDTNADGVTDNGFVYTPNGATATITGYQGTATALTVPLKIEVGSTTTGGTGNTGGTGSTTSAVTYDVTAIGSYAFAGKAGLTSVTMQGGTTGTGNNNTNTALGLQTIGSMAFYGCPSLTTVTIPATVTSIENQAFSDCPALSALNVTAGNQRYVSNDGVLYQYIGYSQGATGIYNTYTLIQYPSGKAGTSYAAPAAIANRLTAVGQGAFAGAQALTSITLPDSVTRIDNAAFQNCSALTSITLPTKVSVIPAYAFSGCSALGTVTIPDTVTSIGEYAFQNCYSLGNVILPERLTTISNGTFYSCTKLTEMTIPSGVVSIGASAFAYCSGLVKVTVPVSVTSIGANAFMGVNGMTMYCHSGSQAANYAASNKIGTVMTYTVRFLSDTGTLLSSQEVVNGSSAQAPSMPERPGYKLTWSSSFSNVTSDLTVTAVYTRVYTVTFIDQYRNKTATDQVEYGKAASAPKWTMSGYNLVWSKSFSSVTGDMTVYASWEDPSTGFVINGSTVKPAAKDTELTKGTVTYRVTSANVQNPKVSYVSNSNANATSVSIPSTVTIDKVTYKVTSIADYAFRNNKKLKSVTMGTNITSIGIKAFCRCSNLSKVTIKSKKLSTIGKQAFYAISKSSTFYAYNSKLKTYQSKIKKSGISTTIKLKAI